MCCVDAGVADDNQKGGAMSTDVSLAALVADLRARAEDINPRSGAPWDAIELPTAAVLRLLAAVETAGRLAEAAEAERVYNVESGEDWTRAEAEAAACFCGGEVADEDDEEADENGRIHMPTCDALLKALAAWSSLAGEPGKGGGDA